jgi:ArsR family transcriptional regulator
MKNSVNKTCCRIFSALANPTRLAIAEILRDGPKKLIELERALKQEQSMISHNLQPLMKCSLVFAKRDGKEQVYYLNNEIMEPLLRICNQHASKYCPSGRKCLTDKQLAELKRKQAASPLYITHG